MIEHVLLIRGTKFEIRALRRPSDRESLLKEYVTSLEKPQQKKIVARLSVLAEMGTAPNTEKFRDLRGIGNLWELKEKPGRILFFFHGRGIIVITHAFSKGAGRTPRQEIERALRLRQMYLEKYRQG